MESCSYGNSQPFFLIFFFWFIFLESRNGCVSGDARQGCLQHPGSPLVSHSSRSWEHRAMKPRSPAFPGRWDSRNVGVSHWCQTAAPWSSWSSSFWCSARGAFKIHKNGAILERVALSEEQIPFFVLLVHWFSSTF